MVGTHGRGGLREGERVVGTGGGGGRGALPHRCSSSCRSRRVGSSLCPPSVSSSCPPCMSLSCPTSMFSSFGHHVSWLFRCRCHRWAFIGIRFGAFVIVWVVWVVIGTGRHVIVGVGLVLIQWAMWW